MARTRRTDYIRVGDQFGQRIVVSLDCDRRGYCLVQCACGQQTECKMYHLLAGNGVACIGCSKKTHVLTDEPEYNVWAQMIQRCNNPKCKAYKNYGGRGISVFPEWVGRGGFANFIRVVGRRPSSKHSIERIDNNGNYVPGNVRWATKVEQCNNMRKSRKITFEGRTQTLSQWARTIGVTVHMLSWRLNNGWPIEKTLTTPSTRATPSNEAVLDQLL